MSADPAQTLAALTTLVGEQTLTEEQMADADRLLEELRQAYREDPGWFTPAARDDIAAAKRRLATHRTAALAERRLALSDERNALKARLQALDEEIVRLDAELLPRLEALPDHRYRTPERELSVRTRMQAKKAGDGVTLEALEEAGLVDDCAAASYPKLSAMFNREWRAFQRNPGDREQDLSRFREDIFGRYPALRGKLTLDEVRRISDRQRRREGAP